MSIIVKSENTNHWLIQVHSEGFLEVKTMKQTKGEKKQENLSKQSPAAEILSKKWIPGTSPL